MMISIDTNVLVRVVVDDNQEQSQQARSLFLERDDVDGSIRIPLIVLVECIWVLKKRYKFPKREMLDFLDKLLVSSTVSLERRVEVEDAVEHWRRGTADFTDYIILAVSNADGYTTTFTFEKQKMEKDSRATVLGI